MQSSCKYVAFSTGLMIEQGKMILLLSSRSRKSGDASFGAACVPVPYVSSLQRRERERGVPANYL